MRQTKKLFAERLENRCMLSASSLAGDADGNGVVEFADFATLANNFGQTDAIWSDGDFDGDGIVQFSDFLILSNNFSNQLQMAEANGSDKITTEFAMVETPCPGLCFTTITDPPAVGTGTFRLDVAKNTFKLKIKAENLKPNHEYVAQITVTKGAFSFPSPIPGVGYIPVGTVRTNSQGKLNFEGHSTVDVRAIFPEGDPNHPDHDPSLNGWRIDQQIFDPEVSDGIINGDDQNYALVCTPTTQIVASADGTLVEPE